MEYNKKKKEKKPHLPLTSISLPLDPLQSVGQFEWKQMNPSACNLDDPMKKD